MIQLRHFPSALLIVLALSAPAAIAFSGPDNCSGQFPLANSLDYELDIQPIFDSHCVHCHQPGTSTFADVGLDLRRGHSYWSLVGKRSVQSPDRWLVQPLTDATSLLTQKIICTSPPVGARMPLGHPPLSIEEQGLILSWELIGPLPELQTRRTSVAAQEGMTGSWYNPETEGQGIVVEMLLKEGQLPRAIVYWFTFNDDIDSSTQQWFVADGRLHPFKTRGVLTIYRSSGGRFDQPEPAASVDPVGTALLKIKSCTEAVFAYRLVPDEEGQPEQTGQIPLMRLSPFNNCEDG